MQPRREDLNSERFPLSRWGIVGYFSFDKKKRRWGEYHVVDRGKIKTKMHLDVSKGLGEFYSFPFGNVNELFIRS